MEDTIIYAISGLIVMFVIALFRVWTRRVGIAGDDTGEEQDLPTRGTEGLIEAVLPEKKKVSKALTDEEWDEMLDGDEITKAREGIDR